MFDSGLLGYELTVGAGLYDPSSERFSGTAEVFHGAVANVNSIESEFGRGWGVAGVQHIIENASSLQGKWEDAALLVDGDGTELLFLKNPALPNDYLSPVGDFSHLVTIGSDESRRFRRTLPDKTVFDFDAANRLQFVTDRNGNVTEYRYANGRLESIIDPLGKATTFTYTNGRIESIEDPAGRTTQLTVDAEGRLETVMAPAEQIHRWDYDSRGLMIEQVNPRGLSSFITYGPAGQVVAGQRKDGTTLSFRSVSSRSLLLESAPATADSPGDGPSPFG